MSAVPEPVRLAALTMADLSRLVEASVLTMGVQIYDAKLVSNPARSGRRIYAEVKGTAASPYAVVIDLRGEGRDLEKAACSCPAAKFRESGGVCKHSAAVLVAWASSPASFVEVPAGAIEALEAERRKKKRAAPKRGKVDTAANIGKGVVSLETLLAELAHTGLGTLTRERVAQVREVAANLRALHLRRLAPECHELGDLLGKSLAKAEDFPADAYARDLADLTFHVRGLARLIERTDTDSDEYRRLADELLGRTWTDKSLTTVTGLRLMDLSYRRRVTPDAYVLEESFLADVGSGDVVKDVLIRPPAIAKRQPPKEDFSHALLQVSDAALYPGYAPRRIRLRSFERRTAAPEDVLGLLMKAPASVDGLSKQLQEQLADVFAPRLAWSLFRPNHLFVGGTRIFAVDGVGKALPLLLDDVGLDVLEQALGAGPAQLLFGTLEFGSTGIEMRPYTVLTGSAQRPNLTSFSQDTPIAGP